MPELLYLSQKDVADVALPLSEVFELVAFALSEKAHGRVEMPPKPGVHPLAGALLHAMPAWIERAGACGINAFLLAKNMEVGDLLKALKLL